MTVKDRIPDHNHFGNDRFCNQGEIVTRQRDRRIKSCKVGRISRFDFNNGIVRHQAVDLFDFFIRYGNAPLCPVHLGVAVPDPCHFRFYSVNHDISTGGYTQLAGPAFILLIWIGDVQRDVIAAALLPSMDGVGPLRRFVIPLLDLGSVRIATQGYFVDFNRSAA